MRRLFGAKKDTGPPPTPEEAANRINKRGDTIDEKIRKCDAELLKYRDQIKRTRPGPAQEAAKARAMRVMRQKKMYLGQRDQLYNQSYNVEQVAFATEGLRDAKATMDAMKAANKELKGQMKTFKIEDVDKMGDDMSDLLFYSSEIQESLGRNYGIPDEVDEEDLMGELDALESDMGLELEDTPSYLQTEELPAHAEADLDLPTAPAPGRVPNQRLAEQSGLEVPPSPMRS